MARLLFGTMLLLLVAVPLLVIALIDIAHSRLPQTALALWVLIVLLFPIVGPILWWAIGKRAARDQTGSSGFPDQPASGD